MLIKDTLLVDPLAEIVSGGQEPVSRWRISNNRASVTVHTAVSHHVTPDVVIFSMIDDVMVYRKYPSYSAFAEFQNNKNEPAVLRYYHQDKRLSHNVRSMFTPDEWYALLREMHYDL